MQPLDAAYSPLAIFVRRGVDAAVRKNLTLKMPHEPHVAPIANRVASFAIEPTWPTMS